jgi:peptidoglycan hydrolase-like protein with peptidoglycan-binding domain
VNVEGMQLILQGYGYLPSSGIDGSFGRQIDSAVHAYQTATGLSSDGPVGMHTWHDLIKPTFLTADEPYRCPEGDWCYWVYEAPGLLGQRKDPQT